jgi:predicted nucleic acid-binding protein
LLRVFGEILVTPIVLREITAGGPGAAELAQATWLRVVAPQSAKLVEQMGIGIDKGESEALALAEERGALLLVDDLQTRRVARDRGIAHTGTAGIVVQAGIDGVLPIDDVEPLLRRLQADGTRLTDVVIRSVLQRLPPPGPR